MKRALVLLCLPLLGACAEPVGYVALSPCPPGALPVCHAGAAGCGQPPFCYRTLGVVDCYLGPEEARRTVEEIVAPFACAPPAPRLVRPG